MVFFNVINKYVLYFAFPECLGLHVQVDKLLFHSADWRRLLPSLLQLCVHQLAAAAAAQDRSAVFQLRGHPHESAGVARDAKAADQGHAAQGLQGSREWQVSSV